MSSGQQILEGMENRLEEAKKRYRNTLEVIKITEKKTFCYVMISGELKAIQRQRRLTNYWAKSKQGWNI